MWALNAEMYMKGLLPLAAEATKSLGTDVPTLIALLVCLDPHHHQRAAGGAIGIAGDVDRALRGQHHRQERQGRGSGLFDVDTLLLDKTGHDHDGQPPGHPVHPVRRVHGYSTWATWRPWPRRPTTLPRGKASSNCTGGSANGGERPNADALRTSNT